MVRYVPCSLRSSASRPRLIFRQRSGASDSSSFWRAMAVMGRCWQARLTQAIGSRRAALLVEERAQVGVGVEVAGQGLHRRAPFLAGVALVEGLHLGHQQSSRPTSVTAPRAAQAVELDAVAAVGERQVLGDAGDRAEAVQTSRGSAWPPWLALGHGPARAVPCATAISRAAGRRAG